MKKRAQAAIEYLLVGAMVTLIILPTMYIFYAYSHTSNEEVKQSQLNKVGTDIVDIAEQVYYLGEPSKVTLDAAMPEGVIGIEVWRDNEVVFFLNDGSEVAFRSKVNITTNQNCIGRCYGNFTKTFHSPGLKNIIIEAKEDHVFIREAGDNQTEQAEIEEELIYCDEDGDTYYSIIGLSFCPSGSSQTTQGDDCNDNNGSVCPNEVLCPEFCNGVNDDCDGSTDEGFTNETCSYICTNNGYEWLATFCCGNDAGEGSLYESPEETCDDENDNDCNGLTDCDDPSCDGQICDEDTPSTCEGGICTPIIPEFEDCITPEDDDLDTFVNCDDLDDCHFGAICNEEGTYSCQDGVYGPECLPTGY